MSLKKGIREEGERGRTTMFLPRAPDDHAMALLVIQTKNPAKQCR